MEEELATVESARRRCKVCRWRRQLEARSVVSAAAVGGLGGDCSTRPRWARRRRSCRWVVDSMSVLLGTRPLRLSSPLRPAVFPIQYLISNVPPRPTLPLSSDFPRLRQSCCCRSTPLLLVGRVRAVWRSPAGAVSL